MSGQAAVQVTGRAVHTTANTPHVPLHSLLPKRWHQCEHPAIQAQMVICDADHLEVSVLLTWIMKWERCFL